MGVVVVVGVACTQLSCNQGRGGPQEKFSACLTQKKTKTKKIYRPCSESLLELVLEPDPEELESSSSSSESSELELLLALSREEPLLPRPAMLPVGVALLPARRERGRGEEGMDYQREEG